MTAENTSRAGLIVTGFALAALIVSLLPQPSAHAVNSLHDNLVSPVPVDWSPRVLDGRVNAIEEVGGRTVIGGAFNEYQQWNSSSVITDRPNLFAINGSNGVIDTGFRPLINGDVQALVASADGRSVYVGGNFTSVNGQTVRNVVKLDVATGQVDPSFSVVAFGSVLDMARRGDRLYISGAFQTINGVSRTGLAEVDATTGQVRDELDLEFSGEKLNRNGQGRFAVTKIDVTADGATMVAIGNFTVVDGQQREQIALIDLLARPARLHDWQTREFRLQTDAAIAAGSQTSNWCNSIFSTYMRGVDFSPDGSYFVVTTTGAANFPRLCDTSTRWTTAERGSNLLPQWIDYNGGDTYYDVASTGAAIYVGGHHRWNNNPFGRDTAGPGAVPREGISALDPRNGLPLSWNPGRARGVGVFDITSTDTGLWIGHDTNRVAWRDRPRATFFPTQSGVLPPDSPGPIPGDLYSGPPPGAANPAFLHRVNVGGDMQFATDGGIDWMTDTNSAPSPYRVGTGGANTSTYTGSGVVDGSVPSATPTGVFNSYRWDPPQAPEMLWSFPVESGREVGVRLYFYNNFSGTSSPGQRIFHVEIDGNRVLNNYDIVADVGHQVGTMKEFAVTSDGSIDIEFLHVLENPLVQAIEIYDPQLLGDGSTADQPLRRRSFDGTSLGADELAPDSGADWSLVRGAFMLSGTLYSGWADGKLYAQPFNGTSFGTRQEVDLYGLTSTQFAISGLTGVTFDPIKGRIYYTIAGQNNLYFRYFTHESQVVGAQQFTAVSGSSAGIAWSGVRGLHLDPGSGTLYLGSSNGELRSVGFADGRPVAGSLSVLSGPGVDGRDWSSRALFTHAPVNYRAPNIAPTALVSAECDGLTCRFGSAGSNDPDGWITSFAWSSSDGGTGTDYGFERTFASAGTYQVSLTVTDNQGATDTTSVEVTVAPPPDPAVAVIEIACEALDCTFDGTNSTPGTGEITSFEWAFSDGGTASGPVVERTFETGGTYEASLTVTDEAGTVASTTTSFQIAEPVDGIELVEAVGDNRNQTNHPLTIPESTAVGDGMVLVLSTASLVDVVELTGEDRWEPLFTEDTGLLRLRAWQTVATAGDAGSELMVQLSGVAKSDVSLYVYRGTSSQGPVAVSALQAATTTTAEHTTPIVEQAVPGTRVLSYWTDRSSTTENWELPTSVGEALHTGIGAGGGRVTAIAADQTSPVAPYGGLTARAVTSTGDPSTTLRAFGATLVLAPLGTVDLAPGELDADPVLLEFGDVTVDTSETLPVTLTNSGQEPVAIDQFTFGGDDAAMFTVTGTQPTTVAAGGTATVDVTFTPTVAGAATATLTITHDGDNTPTVIDLTGTGVVPPLERFEEDDERLLYSPEWTTAVDARYSGGSAAITEAPGARVWLAFEGTEVRWIGTRSRSGGIAEVYIDGNLVDTVDLYTQRGSGEYQAVVFEISDLEPGQHVLEIVNTDRRHPRSNGFRIEIDAIEALALLDPDEVGEPTDPEDPPPPAPEPVRFEQDDARIRYDGTWATATDDRYSGGTAAFTQASGASAEVTFEGTEVRWIGTRSRSGGIADVFINGEPVGEVDLYTPRGSGEYQAVVFEATGLEPGEHDLQIVNTDRRHPRSNGFRIEIDAIEAIALHGPDVGGMQAM